MISSSLDITASRPGPSEVASASIMASTRGRSSRSPHCPAGRRTPAELAEKLSSAPNTLNHIGYVAGDYRAESDRLIKLGMPRFLDAKTGEIEEYYHCAPECHPRDPQGHRVHPEHPRRTTAGGQGLGREGPAAARTHCLKVQVTTSAAPPPRPAIPRTGRRAHRPVPPAVAGYTADAHRTAGPAGRQPLGRRHAKASLSGDDCRSGRPCPF
jgi:hypothetical protein